jgi:hypothetical protein
MCPRSTCGGLSVVAEINERGAVEVDVRASESSSRTSLKPDVLEASKRYVAI